MLGPKRRGFLYNREKFNNLTPSDQQVWEKIAHVVGLETFQVAHASEPAITPGLQLYWLANTLRPLGIYPNLAPPAADTALIWAAAITELDVNLITQTVNNLQNYSTPLTKEIKQDTSFHSTTQSTPTQATSREIEQAVPQPRPLGPVLLEQLNTIAPNNTPYTSNYLASGNHLPNHLPQYLSSAPSNNNHLPDSSIVLQTTVSPSSTIKLSHSSITPSKNGTQYSPRPISTPPSHYQLSIAKQFTTFLLSLLLPLLLKEKLSSIQTPYIITISRLNSTPTQNTASSPATNKLTTLKDGW